MNARGVVKVLLLAAGGACNRDAVGGIAARRGMAPLIPCLLQNWILLRLSQRPPAPRDPERRQQRSARASGARRRRPRKQRGGPWPPAAGVPPNHAPRGVGVAAGRLPGHLCLVAPLGGGLSGPRCLAARSQRSPRRAPRGRGPAAAGRLPRRGRLGAAAWARLPRQLCRVAPLGGGRHLLRGAVAEVRRQRRPGGGVEWEGGDDVGRRSVK